jgi:exonuclease III
MHVDSQSKFDTHKQQNKHRKRTKIASFNVRGLTDPTKQRQLTEDIARYHIDICCLQETKVSEFSDEIVGNTRVILLPGECRHYGLGFALNEAWANRLQSTKSISERIATATFKLSEHDAIMTVIKVYGPTQVKADADEKVKNSSTANSRLL